MSKAASHPARVVGLKYSGFMARNGISEESISHLKERAYKLLYRKSLKLRGSSIKN